MIFGLGKKEVKTEASEEETKSEPHINKETSPHKKDVVGNPMATIAEQTPSPLEGGDLAEGRVIAIDKAALYVTLPSAVGIIYGREFMNARDLIKKIAVGDTITAKVVEPENEDGYVELSLKEARQALMWSEAEEVMEHKTILDVVIKDANKGGLILDWQGIAGFLPASQLKAEHYPRVDEGDKEKILEELRKFIGEKLSVTILSANPQEGKLIFSEKEPEQKEKTELAENYNVGDIVEGEITGIVDFGLFIKIEEGLEGLVHISEMDWGLVEDPRDIFTVGEKTKAQIIDIKNGKISLSIKALKENPWTMAASKYKKGDTVKGVVIKYNKHGALASVEEGVAGLVHISEFENEDELRSTLELGKAYPFMITLFDPEEQKMTLSSKV
ncbi:MAG: S1 RNA-binding domain-containing protein [Candidatus Paceibacterota bacterium]